MNKYVSARQLAKALNIHYNTVLSRIYKGQLSPDHEYDDPKKYFFTDESVSRLIQLEGEKNEQ